MKVKTKNSSPSGILNQASDWVLLGDLDGTFSFLPHLAFTELRSDYLFKQAKKSDLHRTEMPMWRKRGGLAQYQSNKYLPLKSVIDNNGWSVDLFAVKVGAKVYCSTSVLPCFKSLGTAPSIPQ